VQSLCAYMTQVEAISFPNLPSWTLNAKELQFFLLINNQLSKSNKTHKKRMDGCVSGCVNVCVHTHTHRGKKKKSSSER
jgi:hypothetical protein